MSKSIQQLQSEVGHYFESTFGVTPLNQRITDMHLELMELSKWTNVSDLNNSLGDLLASVLAACHELNLDAEKLIDNNRRKIESRINQYKTLGRTTKIALFGGAFNPITIGHIAVAKFVLETSDKFDEVWITPCYKHINNKNLANTEHRLQMCKMATHCDPRIKVFDYEIKHQLSGGTYNFIKQLKNDTDYKDTHEFSMIIGMDNANTFHSWVNFQELEQLINFVVVHREGQMRDDAVDWYVGGNHILLKPDSRLVEMSSTSFRKAANKYWQAEDIFAAHEAKKYKSEMFKFCAEEIVQYVIDNELYVLKK